MTQFIEHCGRTLAVIIPSTYSEQGVKFFTPKNLSQQVAFMSHPTGHIIEPHVHKVVSREVTFTQEVLFLRKGTLRVDFYDDEQQYIESRVLRAGDAILLIEGGHGFEILEEVEIIEVKQGPYMGDKDKTRFKRVDRTQIKIIECDA